MSYRKSRKIKEHEFTSVLLNYKLCIILHELHFNHLCMLHRVSYKVIKLGYIHSWNIHYNNYIHRKNDKYNFQLDNLQLLYPAEAMRLFANNFIQITVDVYFSFRNKSILT